MNKGLEVNNLQKGWMNGVDFKNFCDLLTFQIIIFEIIK